MASSQIQPPPPTNTNTVAIQSIESSVRNLVKSWRRRQRWQRVFNSRQQQDDHGRHQRAPWRSHLVSSLESTPVHVFSICLLLTDLILTLLELSSSLLFCSSSKENNSTGEAWYHWVGIGILGLLCTKSTALCIGLGFSFFGRPGYVVDAAVAMGALFLEVFLEGKGGGLLVVVSLWRVVRVVESVFELSDEAIEAQIEGILREFEALRDENRRLIQAIWEKDELIKKLQEEIDHRKQTF